MTSQTLTRLIDPVLADSGSRKAQRSWINYFNKRRKAMMSAPDVYSSRGIVLNSLLHDFNRGEVVTSTRVCYFQNTLQAKITHDFGSRFTEPTENWVNVPVYDNENLEGVVKDKLGLKYLQCLFDTEDDASKIIETLENIGKRKAKDIKLWTLNRRNYSERAVSFERGNFEIASNVYIWGGSYQLARGVSLKASG